jgi:hypothetical protein
MQVYRALLSKSLPELQFQMLRVHKEAHLDSIDSFLIPTSLVTAEKQALPPEVSLMIFDRVVDTHLCEMSLHKPGFNAPPHIFASSRRARNSSLWPCVSMIFLSSVQ